MSTDTTTTKVSADVRRAAASDAFTAAFNDADLVPAAIAAFTTVPNAKAWVGACQASLVDTLDETDDEGTMAAVKLARVIRAALPETGPSTATVDPAVAAAVTAGALRTFAADLMAAADEALRHAAELSDSPAADVPTTPKMAKVIDNARDLATGATKAAGTTTAKRKSEEADYIDGASFIHGENTLVIEGDTWLVNGEPIEKATPSGAVLATGAANQSGYVYWTVVR